jgi:hypothetical protein
VACVTVAFGFVGTALAQRPSAAGHVDELAGYLDRVEIASPVAYRQLAVYPVLVGNYRGPEGRWLTLDDAVARGVLLVREKGGGSVPVVIVENRSRDEHIFLMTGEVLSGGKQTRTIRNDVVLAPGQRVELSVFCVEAHRWEGKAEFSAGRVLVPQSIQKELRRGADQNHLWSEIARNNQALEAENATGSIELALKAGSVRVRLDEVRRAIVPNLPEGTRGFIFIDRGRAVGAEFFGSERMARELFPKLLDSYAVDCVLLRRGGGAPERATDHSAAIDFFHRVCRAGSNRADTPGSGAGIRTRSGGLLGDGVSLSGRLVHFGVQIRDRIVPPPKPVPIWPRR